MRTVVVTGCSTGIGRATASVLIRRGVRVFGSVRSAADAERLAGELGPQFVPLVFDVTDQSAVAGRPAMSRARSATQTLFGLVNNAGVAFPGPLLYFPIADFRRQIEVNLTGQLIVTQAFAPFLGVDPARVGRPRTHRDDVVGGRPQRDRRSSGRTARRSSRSRVLGEPAARADDLRHRRRRDCPGRRRDADLAQARSAATGRSPRRRTRTGDSRRSGVRDDHGTARSAGGADRRRGRAQALTVSRPRTRYTVTPDPCMFDWPWRSRSALSTASSRGASV